jgi:hypothetical protein
MFGFLKAVLVGKTTPKPAPAASAAKAAPRPARPPASDTSAGRAELIRRAVEIHRSRRRAVFADLTDEQRVELALLAMTVMLGDGRADK